MRLFNSASSTRMHRVLSAAQSLFPKLSVRNETSQAAAGRSNRSGIAVLAFAVIAALFSQAPGAQAQDRGRNRGDRGDLRGDDRGRDGYRPGTGSQGRNLDTNPATKIRSLLTADAIEGVTADATAEMIAAATDSSTAGALRPRTLLNL